MNKSPISGSDSEQIKALHQLQILDTGPEKEFDDIAALAAQICNTPAAVIGFSDIDRLWFKARKGTHYNFTEIPGGLALCNYSVIQNGMCTVVIEDTQKIDLLATHEALQREKIRFIAGVPFINEEGITLGFLYVFDNHPRTLSPQQISALHMLGGQVVTLLKLRLQLLKIAEDEYRATEAQMKSIFQNTIDAVIVTDKKDVILQWNTKAEEMFGWKEEEVLGRQFYEVCIPPRYHQYHINGLKNTPYFNVFVPKNTIETTAIKRNETEFDIALGLSPAKIKDRTYFTYFISDITSRKMANKALDKQKEFYENILNNIPTDIAVFDADHKYIFVNPYAINDADLRKYIIGKDDFEYAEYRKRDRGPAQIRREKFLAAKELAKEIRWEDSFVTNTGKTLTSLRRMFPVHNKNGKLMMVIGFGMDITERKEMEEKQSELLRQLSVQNTQLADFCNIVSHNLRAPLVNMSMLVDFIEDCSNLDEQKLLISKLNPVLDNLSTTFNELVESIQIKQDTESQSEDISLHDCLTRTLEGLDAEIRNLDAVFEIDFKETPKIYYPSKYLNSIFQNLISNSLKYHSPERQPIIQISTKRSGSKVILSVKDNGLGIDLVRHKESFFKIGKVFHHHPHAKGFGLFMTKTHIESMGGRIWIESAPDKGATFFVEFINQSL